MGGDGNCMLALRMPAAKYAELIDAGILMPATTYISTLRLHFWGKDLAQQDTEPQGSKNKRDLATQLKAETARADSLARENAELEKALAALVEADK
jgi:hypothetical protein